MFEVMCQYQCKGKNARPLLLVDLGEVGVGCRRDDLHGSHQGVVLLGRSCVGELPDKVGCRLPVLRHILADVEGAVLVRRSRKELGHPVVEPLAQVAYDGQGCLVDTHGVREVLDEETQLLVTL